MSDAQAAVVFCTVVVLPTMLVLVPYLHGGGLSQVAAASNEMRT